MCIKCYLTENVYEVVSQESFPAQIRQLILYISNHKGEVDGFVQELTFAKKLDKHSSRSPGGSRVPRKALRGGIQKSIIKRMCQLLAIDAHTIAPRTTQRLQERAWNAPAKGLLWSARLPTLHIKVGMLSHVHLQMRTVTASFTGVPRS